MERVARIIVEHSKRILGITGLITVLSLLMLFRMDFNADVSSFIIEGSGVGREFAYVPQADDWLDSDQTSD